MTKCHWYNEILRFSHFLGFAILEAPRTLLDPFWPPLVSFWTLLGPLASFWTRFELLFRPLGSNFMVFGSNVSNFHRRPGNNAPQLPTPASSLPAPDSSKSFPAPAPRYPRMPASKGCGGIAQRLQSATSLLSDI